MKIKVIVNVYINLEWFEYIFFLRLRGRPFDSEGKGVYLIGISVLVTKKFKINIMSFAFTKIKTLA